MSLSLSFEGSIKKLLDFQHWKLNDILIGYYFTTNQLTSTCRVSKIMEVNSLIGEHICYMHSMHNYILLYMYVGRSQEK